MNMIIDRNKIRKWKDDDIFSKDFNDNVKTEFDYVSELLTDEWFNVFLKQLNTVFGQDVLQSENGRYYLDYIESTCGWNLAVQRTCKETDKEFFIKYYDAIPWYVSNIFDVYMVEKIFELNEIRR